MNYSDEELKEMTKGIYFDKHKRDLNIALNGMEKSLKPLNDRLEPLNMMIYISDMNTYLNTTEASSRAGFSIYVDDDQIEAMLTMTDDQLIKKLRN